MARKPGEPPARQLCHTAGADAPTALDRCTSRTNARVQIWRPRPITETSTLAPNCHVHRFRHRSRRRTRRRAVPRRPTAHRGGDRPAVAPSREPRDRGGGHRRAAGSVAAAAALAATGPAPADLPWGAFALLVVCFALLARVRFDVGAGFTVPTQLLFVPMLFLLPAQIVPLAVAAGFVLAGAPEVIRGRLPAGRLALRLGDSWFSLGPALLLALHGGGDRARGGLVALRAALPAQLAVDFAASWARDAAARRRAVGARAVRRGALGLHGRRPPVLRRAPGRVRRGRPTGARAARASAGRAHVDVRRRAPARGSTTSSS